MTEIAPDSANTPQVVALSAARLGATAIVLATVVNALWGTNPVALKLALHGLPPIGCSGIRFAIATIGVAIWLRATGVDLRPRRGEIPWLFAVGAIFTVQIATFTLGVYWGTASHSSVILNTYPFKIRSYPNSRKNNFSFMNFFSLRGFYGCLTSFSRSIYFFDRRINQNLHF